MGIMGIVLFIRVIAILRTMKDISARTNKIFVQIICIVLVGVGTPLI